jgi:uncharacterized membrane protein YcaP (DUF421 family)
MSSLFEMAMPWWEFVLRAVVVYVAILTMVRFAGKRTVGQFTPFDMVLLILLGNAVQNSLLGDDVSLVGGLILAATLIALNYFVGKLSSRFTSVDRLVEGSPVLLARNGQIFRDVLRRQHVSQADFDEAMRGQDCRNHDQIELAMLETNGKISIVKRQDQGKGPGSS